jgi:hypothetical protein
MEEFEGGVQRRREQSREFCVEQRGIQRRSPHQPSSTSSSSRMNADPSLGRSRKSPNPEADFMEAPRPLQHQLLSNLRIF